MATTLRIFPLLLLLLWSPAFQGTQECSPRNFGSDSIVCVCDGQHCDLPGPLVFPDLSHYTVITSSRDGLRFNIETKEIDHQQPPGTVLVKVDRSSTYQSIFGFGGAFTDAAGINIAALSSDAQDFFFRSYFSPDGIEYSIGRIPIAGTDFSVRPYSYDDIEGDIHLEHFSLVEEDLLYKIPQVNLAQELSRHSMRLLASPWSPPSWMKNTGKFTGDGHLLREMWQPYSNYIVRFVMEYKARNVTLWGLATQNDPQPPPNHAWNTCWWHPEDMRDWIKESLGPTLDAAGLGHIKILVNDQARKFLPWFPDAILSDETAATYVDGIAVHWYDDLDVKPTVLDELHQRFPNKFLLYTEACAVPGLSVVNDPGPKSVVLGSWLRAESYAVNIIEALSHHSTGWLDWNIALDMDGGPNWANNAVDAPVIINADQDEFYKQPMFYIMGHFSKYVVPGALRVSSWVEDEDDALHTAAFLHPEGGVVVIILNTDEVSREVSVDDGSGGFANLMIPSKAIQTVVVSVEEMVVGATAHSDTHAKKKYHSQSSGEQIPEE